jgi:hypothetical protein
MKFRRDLIYVMERYSKFSVERSRKAGLRVTYGSPCLDGRSALQWNWEGETAHSVGQLGEETNMVRIEKFLTNVWNKDSNAHIKQWEIRNNFC